MLRRAPPASHRLVHLPSQQLQQDSTHQRRCATRAFSRAPAGGRSPQVSGRHPAAARSHCHRGAVAKAISAAARTQPALGGGRHTSATRPPPGEAACSRCEGPPWGTGQYPRQARRKAAPCQAKPSRRGAERQRPQAHLWPWGRRLAARIASPVPHRDSFGSGVEEMNVVTADLCSWLREQTRGASKANASLHPGIPRANLSLCKHAVCAGRTASLERVLSITAECMKSPCALSAQMCGAPPQPACFSGPAHEVERIRATSTERGNVRNFEQDRPSAFGFRRPYSSKEVGSGLKMSLPEREGVADSSKFETIDLHLTPACGGRQRASQSMPPQPSRPPQSNPGPTTVRS